MALVVFAFMLMQFLVRMAVHYRNCYRHDDTSETVSNYYERAAYEENIAPSSNARQQQLYDKRYAESNAKICFEIE